MLTCMTLVVIKVNRMWWSVAQYSSRRASFDAFSSPHSLVDTRPRSFPCPDDIFHQARPPASASPCGVGEPTPKIPSVPADYSHRSASPCARGDSTPAVSSASVDSDTSTSAALTPGVDSPPPAVGADVDRCGAAEGVGATAAAPPPPNNNFRLVFDQHGEAFLACLEPGIERLGLLLNQVVICVRGAGDCWYAASLMAATIVAIGNQNSSTEALLNLVICTQEIQRTPTFKALSAKAMVSRTSINCVIFRGVQRVLDAL